MMCPRCGHKYVCPCSSCTDRTRGQIRWKGVGDIESCGVCGLSAHISQWFDEECWQLPGAHSMRLSLYVMRPGREHLSASGDGR